jgi:hypothetical protein
VSDPIVKFLRGTCLYILAVYIICMLIVNMCLVYKPATFNSQGMDYTLWTEQMKRIDSKSEFRNVVIGDSRGNAGFDPLKFGGQWQNLSLMGGSLIEAYLTYHRHIKSDNRLDTLLIMFSVQHMEEEPRWFSRNAISYQLIDEDELEILESKEREQNWFYGYGKTTSRADLHLRQIRRRLRFYNFPLNFLDNFEKGFKDLLYRKKMDDSIRTSIVHSLRTTRGHVGYGKAEADSTVGLSADGTFSLTYINRYYFEKLLTELESAGTKVFFFVAPHNESSCRVFSGSRHEASMRSALDSFQKKYPNLTVETGLMCLPDSCFGDPSHLNLRGVDTYQPLLRERINSFR